MHSLVELTYSTRNRRARTRTLNSKKARKRLRHTKELAHTASADADKHLVELGAGAVKEGDVRLARDGARKQSLARARRTHEQNALGKLAAQASELGRVAKELYNLCTRGSRGVRAKTCVHFSAKLRQCC